MRKPPEARLRRELETLTQHPDESQVEYVRAMQELYLLGQPNTSYREQVELVVRQSHPTFTAYFRSGKFRNLNELALEVKRVRPDILAARSYRLPSPAHQSLEPRCAGRADTPSRTPQGHAASYAVSREPKAIEPFEIPNRALDPYV